MKIQVHRDDKILLDIIRPDMQRGPWIAGGAVLQWLKREPVGLSDIDIFTCSKEQAKKVYDKLLEFGYSERFKSDDAVTMVDASSNRQNLTQIVQVIHGHYFKTPRHIIEAFDFSVIQLVTDGDTLLCGPNTLSDIETKTIRAERYRSENIVKRMVKYMTYGYAPEPHLIDKVLNDTEINIDFNGHHEYNFNI